MVANKETSNFGQHISRLRYLASVRNCAPWAAERNRLVDQFHETSRIGRMELKPTDLILRRRTDLGFTRDRHIKCGAPSRRPHPEELGAHLILRRSRPFGREPRRMRAERLEGWPRARSRLWRSFEP